MQKWGGIAGEPLDDYDIFMATSQKSGKDNSGNYIYKIDELGNQIDEDGNPTTESNKPPAIDHDLDEIAEAFVAWGKYEQGFSFLVED